MTALIRWEKRTAKKQAKALERLIQGQKDIQTIKYPLLPQNGRKQQERSCDVAKKRVN